MSYLERLSDTMIAANERALQHAMKVPGSGKAWDNVKKKNRIQYAPRGNAYRRLDRVEVNARHRRLKTGMTELLESVKRASE